MSKIDWSKAFKNGADFKAKKVDWNSPKMKRELEEIKKQQQAVRDSQKIDINYLRTIVIDI